MKTLKIMSLLLVVVLSFGLSGCGDDEEKSIDDPSEQGSNENTSDNDAQMEKAIRQYVYSIISYLDYSYQIEIVSNVADLYTTKTFRYGIECGYGSYDWEKYATHKQGNIYVCVSSVFIETEDEFATESFYWSSYIDLLKKKETRELREDEQQLYDDIVKILRKSENKAKNQYQGRVFVEVDGNRYYIKDF